MNRLIFPSPRRRPARGFAGVENVELVFGEILQHAGERIRHVYFPSDSVVSLLTTRAQGKAPVEVGLIGNEGMLGASLALGVNVASVSAEVQATGSALRLTAAQFVGELGRSPTLRRGVHRYIHDLGAQVMQTAACNRNHSPEQRLARWLLMMRERMSSDRIKLTQKFLGAMIGVRRAGISEVVGTLQRRKLIVWRRGTVSILDRAGLEAAACGCFRLLKLGRR